MSIHTALLIILYGASGYDTVSAAGENCMSGPGIHTAFVVDGTCYWALGPDNYTGMASAIEACATQWGEIAFIKSDVANTAIAQKLTRPAFIGYVKQMDGSWQWLNDTYTYTKTFTDSGGVHIAITEGTGQWETTQMDAKGHLYDLLCSIDQVPHLQCETVTVPNSVNSVAQPLFSGESIKFTCNDGFHVTVLVTVQELTCLPPKKWSYPARPCKAIECDLVDLPVYTTRDSEKHLVGDDVKYTCANDTWFFPTVDSMVFSCTGNGEWSPPLRPCEVIRCEKPPRLIKGELDTTNTLFGSVITYKCVNGYAFPGGTKSLSITCEGSPQAWSGNISLACEQISCPMIPAFGDGAYQRGVSQELFVGYYQVWWCRNGYNHATGNTGTSTVCVQSANPAIDHDWERPVPQCIQVGCPALTVGESNITAVQDIYPFDYPLKYTCDEGHVLPGGETEVTLKCQSDTQWDWNIPISGCDESGCESGWVEYEGSCYFISNGNSLGLRYEYAEQSCNFKSSSLALISSEKEALWLSTVTYEIYNKDFWIGYHLGPSKEWEWKGDFVTNFTYFAEGYPEFYDCARSSVKGYWKDRDCDSLLPYVCKKTSICGASPEIAEGAAVSLPRFPVNVGTEVTYVCNEGFRFRDGGFNVTIKCELGGFWTKIGNCVEDLCPRLNSPSVEIHGAWFDTTLTERGTVVTYTCQDGKLFSDGSRQKTIECLPGGNWTKLDDECEGPLKCPMPASPATTGEFNVNEWGQMDYYQCKPGYSFADAEVHKLFWCTRDGTWLPVGQTCIRRACPKISVFFATVTPDEGVFEDVIEVNCFSGYQFEDTSVKKLLTCQSNGAWSASLTTCVPTKCDGPKPPDVEGAYRDTDVINSFTKVNYTCLHELVFLNGDKSRIAYCDNTTLQWINVPPTCVEAAVVIHTEFSHPPVEAQSAKTFGAIGIGTLVSIIVLVIALDALTAGKFLTCLKSDPSSEMAELNDLEAAQSRPVTGNQNNSYKEEDNSKLENEVKNNKLNNEQDDETGSEYETDTDEEEEEEDKHTLKQ